MKKERKVSQFYFATFPPLRKVEPNQPLEKVEPNILLYFFKSGKVVSKKGLVIYRLHL
jgi:hypothetical protein